jgi:hypothetical protein
MKQLTRLFAGALVASLPFVGISGLAAAQGKAPELKPQLVGVWRVISAESQNIETKEISHFFGEKPIGAIHFSSGGNFTGFATRDNLPKPAKLPYTDAEGIAIWRGILSGAAGTYTVKGNTLTLHVLTSYRPDQIGDLTRQFEIKGKNLIMRLNTVGNNTGQKIVFTTTYERVE